MFVRFLPLFDYLAIFMPARLCCTSCRPSDRGCRSGWDSLLGCFFRSSFIFSNCWWVCYRLLSSQCSAPFTLNFLRIREKENTGINSFSVETMLRVGGGNENQNTIKNKEREKLCWKFCLC